MSFLILGLAQVCWRVIVGGSAVLVVLLVILSCFGDILRILGLFSLYLSTLMLCARKSIRFDIALVALLHARRTAESSSFPCRVESDWRRPRVALVPHIEVVRVRDLSDW